MDRRCRSAISNGSRHIVAGDQRTKFARRGRDVYLELASDQGGEDQCSEAMKSLMRRAAALIVRLEVLEARIAAGDDVDDEDLVRLVNTLARCLNLIGLKRQPRRVGPTLSEYLGHRVEGNGDARPTR